MNNNAKNFLVSTADFALYHNDILACTGTTNLNASIEVSMQEQNVNAGKGNKLVYSFKYDRELSITLEAADWKLEYIAAQVGTTITEGLSDVYKLGENISVTNGIGTLSAAPIGDVAVELPNGSIVVVTPGAAAIDLKKYGVENDIVKATYQYTRLAKQITVNGDTVPNVYRLVLDTEKHNNRLGRIGSVQIIVPSYQPSGSFTMNFTPEGVSSTSIAGKALAVEGDSCADGSFVYAYIREFDDTASVIDVSELAVTPAAVSLTMSEDKKTAALSVIGLKGALYSPIQLNNADCTFVSDAAEVATVDQNGVVTAVGTGTAKITVTYNKVADEVAVTVA